MCGICGIFNLGDGAPPDSALLRRMVAALRHRGPDGNGGYGDRHILLGHSRLAIIDLSGGAQPMSNEDDSLWVVFNGEIFNYLELGEELKQAGHRFRSRSDTEVLLHAYEQWGPTFVERCNGQFAFALWDRPQRRLMLCRDRVGILPLYYAQHGQRLFFASEIKALLQEPELPRRLDPRGLAEVFTFWTPVPPRTALTGIRQLRPGTLLLVEQGGRTEEKEYWQPVFPEQRPGFAHAGDERLAELAAGLRDRLEEATRLRMLRSDVPVGVYLSGGLDSSVIAALVRRFHQGPLRTFSLRFEHPDFDEGAFQQEMVQRLATEHSAVEVGYRAIARWFPEVIQATETPVLRTAPAPLFLLSGLVRQNGFKVVLTGEGSDEFLAGYDLFREDKVRRFWARCPGSQLRPLLLGRLYPWMVRAPAQAQALQRSFFGRGLAELEMPHFSHIPRWSSTAGLQRLFSRELLAALAGFSPVEELVSRLPPEANRWEPLCRAQYLEITTLLSGYLLSSQGDRMLMGHSVEGRFPFLDHHVMEYANSLPPEAKLCVLDEKHVLKRAAREMIPASILRRPKQPYRAPDAQSFVQDDVPEYVAELLSPAALRAAGVFEPEAVRLLMAKCRRTREQTPSNTDNMAVVGVLSTQLVHHLLLQGHGLRTEPPAALDYWFSSPDARP